MARPFEKPIEKNDEKPAEKIRTTVRIAGREYTMTGTDSEEHMHRVAAYVDRKMEELTLTTRMPPNMVSVLTALNVADELLKSQDENARLRREMTAQQQQMAKLRAQASAPRPAGKAKGGEGKADKTAREGEVG